MPALTSGEKALLRADGHKAKLYLSVFKPATLLSARLNNASIARGDRSIAYDSGTGTGFASIVAGQPLWVGTSAGAKDKGVVRIKSITGSQSSGTITVAENAIDWADDDYLTVLHDYPLFPVFPYIDPGGNFYKDRDVAYTDENEYPPPVAIIGPHRAAFLDETTGEAEFALDASDSYAIAPGATVSTYAWTFSGTGSFDDDTSATPTLTVTAANPDGDWLACTVTDSNGKSQITRRVLFPHERTGGNAPYTALDVQSFGGDWERGGWGLSMTVSGDATRDDFPDKTLVVLWHEAWYGATEQFIGGIAGAKSVLFAGYLQPREMIQWDAEAGTVTFEAATINGLLGRLMMFSVALETARSPAAWYQYLTTGLTVARAVHHLWRWQSTLFSITDVMLPTSNTLRLKYCDDFVKSSLYSQADNFARRYSIFAHAACTKQGRLYVEEDIQMLDSTARAAKTVVTDVTDADLRENAAIGRLAAKQADMAKLSGFSFDGSKATALMSKAPGDVPEDEGMTVANEERQVLDDQSQANELCGRVLATANNEFDDVRLRFAGHYLGALDVVPQEWLTWSLAAADTPRGLIWTDKKLVCRSISATIDAEAGTILTDAAAETEAEGPDGVTGDYPSDVPDAADDPEAPRWPPGQALRAGDTLFVFGEDGCYFRPGQTSGADWSARNTGVSPTDDLDGGWDAWFFTPAKQGTADPGRAILIRCQVGKILLSKDGGGIWKDVTPLTDPPNSWSDATAPTASTVTYFQRLDSIHQNGLHIIGVEWQEPDSGSDKWRAWLLKTEDDFESYVWESLYQVYGGNLITNGTFDTSCAGWTPCNTGDVDWDAGRLRFAWRALSATYAVGTSFSALAGIHRAIGTFDRYAAYDDLAAVETKLLPYGGWSSRLAWPNPDTGTKTADFALAAGNYDIRLICRYKSGCPIYGWWDNIVLYSLGTAAQSRILWMDLDSEDGSVLWLTVWRDDALHLQKRLVSDLSQENEFSLGSATQVEMEAQTYWTHPHTPPFDKNYCAVFGRMNAPAGLSGVRHVILTTTGGTSFSSVENGWGNDVCGALLVGELSGSGQRVYVAVRNDMSGGAPSKIYRGVVTPLSLGLKSSLPFANGVKVAPGGLSMSGSGQVAVGAWAAGAVMVVISDDLETWTDITGSHPATGPIWSVVYI